jgi:mono/diheme cytochrome c family protein
MTTGSPQSLRMRKILLVSLFVVLVTCVAFAVYNNREWKIPEEAKRLKNPVPPSEAAMKSARRIYLDNCTNCHGDKGKGDGSEAMMYDPGPADLTDAKQMDHVTDGEIFYQITRGRKPMPSFRKRLTEEQRWQLVLLVRSFAAPSTSPSEAGKKPVAKP